MVSKSMTSFMAWSACRDTQGRAANRSPRNPLRARIYFDATRTRNSSTPPATEAAASTDSASLERAHPAAEIAGRRGGGAAAANRRPGCRRRCRRTGTSRCGSMRSDQRVAGQVAGTIASFRYRPHAGAVEGDQDLVAGVARLPDQRGDALDVLRASRDAARRPGTTMTPFGRGRNVPASTS